MLRAPPASRLEPEVTDHELGWLERAVAVAQCHVHPGIAEPDDVRLTVPGDVRHEPRVPVHPPATGGEAEVREYHPGRLERAAAAAQRRPYPRVAEAAGVR